MTMKSTVKVNGGAMPKFDRAAIMTKAWAIFREAYHCPAVPFRSIGRPCFGWALREAWRRAREAARVAAIPAEVKAARIASLNASIDFEQFNDHWPSASANIAEMRAEIARLAA